MESEELEETIIEGKVDPEANSVWLQPVRGRFGRTELRDEHGKRGEVSVHRIRWVFRGVPPKLRPVLVFDSFIPEPGKDREKDMDGPTLAALARDWDRLLGPCKELEAEGLDQLVGHGIAERPRGFYMYRVALIPRDEAQAHSIRMLDCTSGPAGAIEPPPEPIGRTG